MIPNLLALAAALALLAPPAHAAGLRTPFGEVIVKNLKIGQVYSLYKLVNLPLRVVNTGDDEVDLTIEPVPIPRGAVREGYEPVPALGWVRLEQSSFTVAANREVTSDVIISIPNDPALLGRRFEADIWSHTTSLRSTFGVGLISKLFLHVDSTPPTEEELKKKYIDERVANLDFSVLPTEKDVDLVPLGRPIDLRKEKKAVIKLINPNERALNFRVRSIPVWESMITPPQGYEAAFNAQWLKPERDVVKVDGNSIGEMNLTLSIPDEPRVRGKKFMFVVSVEVLEQKIPTHVYYRLRATTPPAVDKEKTK